MRKYKIGSLFDGSGGFPLAGSLCGIEPVWASEIEPYPIAVTRSRFPNMKHLGDISKINGGEIEPVDIITFGSPCQDLSVAGKRAGLKHEANGDEETTRSGLFMEAVRIIKEMRRKTNGRYPTFALWENVPGAFSSNQGEDFRVVCEELIKIVEPSAVMPSVPKNGWAYADCYCGDGWSLAYRVFDAQYWGVPQCRRRIHLVLDLRGERAGKISFEREGLRGYLAEGRTQGEATSGDVGSCFIAADSCRCDTRGRENNGCRYGVGLRGGMGGGQSYAENDGTGGQDRCIGFHLLQDPISIEGKTPCLTAGNCANGQASIGVVMCAGFKAGQGDKARSIGWDVERCPTLAGEAGGNSVPSVCIKEIYCIDGDKIGKADRAGGSGLGIRYGDKMYTLTAKDAGAHAVCYTGAHQEPTIRYIVRRLTTTECARLQGFADRWGDIDPKEDFTDEEYKFWLDVRNTHAAINSKAVKEYSKAQMLAWYNKLHTDSAEYKMWGNGIALPPALYVMLGIADALEVGVDG